MVWLIIAAVAAASPTAANNDPQIQTQISLCAFVFSKEGSRNSSCCSLPFRNCHLNQPFVVLILLFCYYFWQVQLWFWPLMLIIHYFFMRSLWHQWCNSIGAVSCCWYRMTSCLCGRSYVSTQVNWFKHVNAVVKHVRVVHFWPCCTFSARIHCLKANEKFLMRDGCESVKVLQPITAEHSSQNTEWEQWVSRKEDVSGNVCTFVVFGNKLLVGKTIRLKTWAHIQSVKNVMPTLTKSLENWYFVNYIRLAWQHKNSFVSKSFNFDER